jgi:hypothetical protein
VWGLGHKRYENGHDFRIGDQPEATHKRVSQIRLGWLIPWIARSPQADSSIRMKVSDLGLTLN